MMWSERLIWCEVRGLMVMCFERLMMLYIMWEVLFVLILRGNDGRLNLMLKCYCTTLVIMNKKLLLIFLVQYEKLLYFWFTVYRIIVTWFVIEHEVVTLINIWRWCVYFEYLLSMKYFYSVCWLSMKWLRC